LFAIYFYLLFKFMSDHQLNVYINKLKVLIADRFTKDSSHDIAHFSRVYNIALKIQKKEGGDRLIIGVGAFVHDVHRSIQADTGKYCEPKDSLPIVKNLLNKINFPKDKIDGVLHVVEYHEEYSFTKKGKTVHDIETLVVQDADNLDAMGAVGIARTFTFGAKFNRPLWIPDLSYKKKYYADSKIEESTLMHFESKLLKLLANMNTKAGKQFAKERHQYMVKFVDRFKREWKGDL
jgi:uncharacterized protein